MLNLYIMETCPYCRKVMDFLDKNNIEYKKFDTLDNDNVLRLLTIGGKDQVPFLHDTDKNKKMYESDEIIKYVQGIEGITNG